MADYQPYIDAQEKVGKTYLDVQRWTKMSILNVARIGYFSSDRAIREYCQNIWKISPVRIELEIQKPAQRQKTEAKAKKPEISSKMPRIPGQKPSTKDQRAGA